MGDQTISCCQHSCIFNLFLQQFHTIFSTFQRYISSSILPCIQRTDRIAFCIHIEHSMHLAGKSNTVRTSIGANQIIHFFYCYCQYPLRILNFLLGNFSWKKRLVIHGLSGKQSTCLFIHKHDTDCGRTYINSHYVHNSIPHV